MAVATDPTLRRRHGRHATVIAALGLSAVLLAGCAPAETEADLLPVSTEAATADTQAPTPTTMSPSPTPSDSAKGDSSSSRSQQEAGSAIAAVEALTVKGRAPKTGYDRDQFGSGWVDVDRNGCDTRNDMLKATLIDKDMAGSCKVLAGTLADPYTGDDIDFVRGGASEVDLDHVVALGDAWQKGAARWPYAKRVAFANDPLNLQPADAGANRQKGDSDAASWLPPNKSYRCTYVARQAAVKQKYGLWVTAAEKEAMLRVLSTCPGHELPGPGAQPTIASNTGGPAPRSTSTPTSRATTKPTPKPSPKATSSGSSGAKLDPRFRTCGDANDAGYGPYFQGKDPEYEWYQDRDKDGAACES